MSSCNSVVYEYTPDKRLVYKNKTSHNVHFFIFFSVCVPTRHALCRERNQWRGGFLAMAPGNAAELLAGCAPRFQNVVIKRYHGSGQ